MAIGGTRVLAPTDIRTRIVLTSRPYLVTQVYTTDTGTIYDDAGSTDGTLLDHLSQEIDKLDHDWTRLGLPDSTRIEVHPKIAAKPFNGVHIARFTIRPPDPAGLAGPTFGEAQVSFQFTCRSGVGVQVIGFDDIVGKKRQARVELLVVLNSAGYQPPRLPPRQEYVPTDKQLEDASTLVGVELIADLFGPNDPLTKANIAQALLRGILTDAYDVPGVNLLDKTHAVPFVEVINIPGAAGIVVDDDQPYPVFGFLDIRWHRPDIIRGGGP